MDIWCGYLAYLRIECFIGVCKHWKKYILSTLLKPVKVQQKRRYQN